MSCPRPFVPYEDRVHESDGRAPLHTSTLPAQSKGTSNSLPHIKEYRQKIEAELAKICRDILEVLDSHLIKAAESGESRVFYHKMWVLLELSFYTVDRLPG